MFAGHSPNLALSTSGVPGSTAELLSCETAGGRLGPLDVGRKCSSHLTVYIRFSTLFHTQHRGPERAH